MDVQAFLEAHAKLAEKSSTIDPELHSRYNTKRGLRNDNGTGVLIGLTEIGEVHGYVVDDQERVPTEGRLSYRGIDVAEIVKGFQADHRFGFEEVAYLLLFGSLPKEDDLAEFRLLLRSKRALPEGFMEDMILSAPSKDIMNKLGRSILAAYSYDETPEDPSIANVLRQLIDMIARFPTFVAYGYQAKRHYYDGESLFIHTPDRELTTSETVLQLIRPDKQFTPLEAETLDLALVLHAEHGGGNNSAFTIHVVSSADTDTYSAVAAGVGSLKGAKHGGAAQRVVSMIDDIKAHVSDWGNTSRLTDYLVRILRKDAYDRSGLVYGIGHAVYTKSDPRAVLLHQKARDLAAEKNREAELELYENIARITPLLFQDEKHTDRVISPNVDFFSGFVYRMLNIPEELFTPLFAVARIAGWSAHRLEEIVSGGKIIRPAYKNVLGRIPYVPMTDR